MVATGDELLPAFDQEMTTTMRVIERIPADRLTWKPHENSMSLGEPVTHIVLDGCVHWDGQIYSDGLGGSSPHGSAPHML
jgi:hypothetical protein